MSEPITAIDKIIPSRHTFANKAPQTKANANLFGQVFKNIADTPTRNQVYVVRQGDTLSGICKKQLAQQGQPPKSADINFAVKEVAKANHLQSADKIYVGQKIDLNCLAPNTQMAKGGRAVPWRPGWNDLKEVLALLDTQTNKKASPAANLAVVDAAKITSQFGMRLNPFSRRPERHEGIDFAAQPNAPVYAAMPGKVIFSGWQSGYGKTIIIQHENGSETLYAHNSKNLVKTGQHIEGHSIIAKVGSTGDSTGPHVHFELRQHGHAVDPAKMTSDPLVQVTQAPQRLNVIL